MFASLPQISSSQSKLICKEQWVTVKVQYVDGSTKKSVIDRTKIVKEVKVAIIEASTLCFVDEYDMKLNDSKYPGRNSS